MLARPLVPLLALPLTYLHSYLLVDPHAHVPLACYSTAQQSSLTSTCSHTHCLPPYNPHPPHHSPHPPHTDPSALPGYNNEAQESIFMNGTSKRISGAGSEAWQREFIAGLRERGRIGTREVGLPSDDLMPARGASRARCVAHLSRAM